MPVRIYDISKKLGLENKEVLSKAKELGIAAARVASSSLDKITAEYLEQQLVLAHPERAVQSPVVQSPASAQQAKHEPIVVVSAPPAEVEALQKEEPMMGTATAVLEAEPPPAETEIIPAEPPPPPSVATAIAEPEPQEEPVAEAAPIAPPPPAPPAGPKVGDKVGFIQLPTKPAPKAEEKFGAPKLPPRPPEQPVTLPQSSAITSRPVTPLAKACP